MMRLEQWLSHGIFLRVSHLLKRGRSCQNCMVQGWCKHRWWKKGKHRIGCHFKECHLGRPQGIAGHQIGGGDQHLGAAVQERDQTVLHQIVHEL